MDNPNRTQNVGDDPEQPQQNPQTPGQRQGENQPQEEPDKDWNPSGGAEQPDRPGFERGTGQQGGSQGQSSQKPASESGSNDWEEKE